MQMHFLRDSSNVVCVRVRMQAERTLLSIDQQGALLACLDCCD